ALSNQADARSSERDGLSNQADARSSERDALSNQADARSSEGDGLANQADARSSERDAQSNQADARSSERDARSSEGDGLSSEADGLSSLADAQSSEEDAAVSSHLPFSPYIIIATLPMLTSIRSRLGLTLVLAPVAGQFLVVFFLGVNTPVADEFFHVRFVQLLRQGSGWLPAVWMQHNEHRIVPVKLTMALLAPFVGWNLKAEMYVSAVLAGLTVLGLWRLYRQAGGKDLLLFAPVAWLYCNLSQYENMLYGLLMCHYFTAAGAVWALVFLDRRSRSGLVLAILCGLVASLSIVNGVLVWPLGLFLLLARRERLARTLTWSGAGAATAFLYFATFTTPQGLATMHVTPGDLPRMARYALAALGSPLAAGSIPWSAVTAGALLLLAAALGLRWIRQGRDRVREEAPLGSLVLFGLLSCAVIAAGRALTGVPALESRYVAYTALAFAGVYLLVSRDAESSGESPLRSPRLAAVLALLIPGLIAADVQGLRDAQLWRLTRLREQFLLQTYDRQPDAVFGDPAFVRQLRASMAPYLRAERLTAFA